MDVPHMRWPLRAAPVIYVAGRYPLEPSAFDVEYCARTHALHLYDYEATIRMEGRDFPVEPGVVTLSVAGGRTSYNLAQRGYHWCLHFYPLPVRGATMLLPWHLAAGSHREFFTDRMRHIARLHDQAQRQGPRAKLADAAASIALQELLLWLGMFQARHETGHALPRSAEAVDKLLTILNENFAEPLTVPGLAAQVGLSQDRLARVFREEVGLTIPRYLLQRRIEHARQLLTTTDLPVQRIGARVGLPDPQHFNKQFRLLTGLNPTQVRLRKG